MGGGVLLKLGGGGGDRWRFKLPPHSHPPPTTGTTAQVSRVTVCDGEGGIKHLGEGQDLVLLGVWGGGRMGVFCVCGGGGR